MLKFLMFKRDIKLNRQFLTQFLNKISEFPNWVKEIIYVKLSEEINKDSNLAYTFATYKPILTYKGKCELDFKKSGFDTNIYNILSMFENLLFQLTPLKETGYWDEVLLKYVSLLELIYEEKNYGLYNYNIMNIYLFCAIDKARIKDQNLTIYYLKHAINHATICTKLKQDNKIIISTSFLVNHLQDDPTTWPISSNILFNIILEEINKPEYDFIRNNQEFNEIINYISKNNQI